MYCLGTPRAMRSLVTRASWVPARVMHTVSTQRYNHLLRFSKGPRENSPWHMISTLGC